MIVFNLICDNAHGFEGWFRSSDAFAEQQSDGLLSCPMCDSAAVTKAPMAPAVPAKSNRSEATTPIRAFNKPLPPEVATAFKALAAAQAKALSASEWVGDRFATEARSMHYGEGKAKQIHGRASSDDAAALIDEGIAVLPLLVPFHPPEELN